MARLCIRVAPNDHPTDPELNKLRTQPGDVVCIVNDDHQFSQGELNCGQYRIIDVPGVPQIELIYLCKQHVDDVEGNPIQRRLWSLDAAALRVGQWRDRTSATQAQIDAIVITRAS